MNRLKDNLLVFAPRGSNVAHQLHVSTHSGHTCWETPGGEGALEGAWAGSSFSFFFIFWRHPALQSQRRGGMNTKWSKFQQSYFIWETKIKQREEEMWLWWGWWRRVWGGVHQIIPAHRQRSVPRGPSSHICVEYICASLNQPSFLHPFLPSFLSVLTHTLHETCFMTSICFGLCICKSPSVSSCSQPWATIGRHSSAPRTPKIFSDPTQERAASSNAPKLTLKHT